MKLDPRMVIQFAVIAEEGSFTRAAERLCVAQPWLSARLKKLETQLGFPLFDRSTRHVTLTDKGHKLLQAARNVQASMTATEALAAQLQRRDEGRLRIGTPPYSHQIAVRPDLIDRFGLHQPNIHIELDFGWTPGLIQRVMQGELDLAFVLGEQDNQALETIRLCELNVELMMAADHPLASEPKLVAANLKNHTVALFNRALYPALYDTIYLKWADAGALLIPFVELNQALLDRALTHERIIIACFEMKDRLLDEKAIIRRTLEDSCSIPFSLVRRVGCETPESQRFWEVAQGYASAPSQRNCEHNG
ncbi:LysR family transcriptional regulator [Pseudomonas sp. H9]|uniref:LysR substrate-binding domain-containing protein n=1 Tax=Pseudomonas sp. H9 TaxID=483968 RepID=UPI001057CDE6|nr:LysR family transcriptional regulator [Pseudomonas sp. H9]TDF83853.1 LysR family transcriptional regulator [Pseudomonas sp. H9]